MATNALANKEETLSPMQKLKEVEPEVHEAIATNFDNADVFILTVLQHISRDQFDKACDDLKVYYRIKSVFPTYSERTNRLYDVTYALIDAIKKKKSALYSANLSASKKTEIYRGLAIYMKQLKGALRNIVYVERSLKVKDSRQTILALRAMTIATFFLYFFYLSFETIETMWGPVAIFADSIIHNFFRFLGF